MLDPIEIARTYKGTPFHHQGRVKGVGVDCIGLLVLWAREIGAKIDDVFAYSREPDGRTLIAQLSRQLDRVIGEPSYGDVLAIWHVDPRLPQHVAIRTPSGILHTNMSVGKVCEHTYTPAWRKRTHSAWRLRMA